MTTQPQTHSETAKPVRSRRLRVWFVTGFLIVFVSMLLLVTTHFMHPSGRGIVQVTLWQYYLIQIPQLFAPQHLGPATSDSSAAIAMLFQHALLAGLGGLAALGIAWAAKMSKLRSSPRT